MLQCSNFLYKLEETIESKQALKLFLKFAKEIGCKHEKKLRKPVLSFIFIKHKHSLLKYEIIAITNKLRHPILSASQKRGIFMNPLEQIAYPTIDSITSALFIQPHPDDNEIAVGGLMAQLSQNGIPVYAVTVTQGDGGSDVYTPQELAQIRHHEAQHAADILGITYLGNLGFNNTNPGTIEEITEKIVEVIRSVKPDAIFSVDPDLPNETHPVHLRVGRAVMEAFQRTGQTFYPFHIEGKKVAHKCRILGQYFTIQPTTYVDISREIDLKKAAILAHTSQIDETFIANLQALDSIHGIKAGVAYAEPIKLLSAVHTHCFTLTPEDLKMIAKMVK